LAYVVAIRRYIMCILVILNKEQSGNPGSGVSACYRHLHGAIVDDDGVERDTGVELRNLLARPQEEAVSELHDVGLVHCSHLGPMLRFCKNGNL
jgi:hypothetical protein